MKLFGYELKKVSDAKKAGTTFTTPTYDDGAIEIENDASGVNFAGQYVQAFDLDSMVPNDEFELILSYRDVAIQQEVDEALQEIFNEAIISDDREPSVSIILEDLDVSEGIKNKIRDEFDYLMQMLKFKTNGYNIFRRWYIDGRLYYHKVMDKSSAKKGIVELVSVDPLNIRMVREYKVQRGDKKAVDSEVKLINLKDIEEYFIFSEKPFTEVTGKRDGLRIHRDAVAYVPSGLMDASGRTVLSQLHKALKPFNNLKLLEDSVVIYRVTRAPERRIFYVDVGNLPKNKAEQYLKNIMDRFRNKVVYDANKGTVNNRTKYQSMMEDFWLPRREGGRGTEVSTLPGGENLGELSDVEYFKNKLYKSLNIPLSRFQQDSQAFNIGRTTEITRDEIKFSKFIRRLRKKFAELFDDLLKTQLILKGIITPDEWEDFQERISYDFLEDNYFQELKVIEILSDRLEAVDALNRSGIVGKYISHDTIRRKILHQSEDEMKEEDKKIGEEKTNEQYNPKDEEQDQGGFG